MDDFYLTLYLENESDKIIQLPSPIILNPQYKVGVSEIMMNIQRVKNYGNIVLGFSKIEVLPPHIRTDIKQFELYDYLESMTIQEIIKFNVSKINNFLEVVVHESLQNYEFILKNSKIVKFIKNNLENIVDKMKSSFKVIYSDDCLFYQNPLFLNFSGFISQIIDYTEKSIILKKNFVEFVDRFFIHCDFISFQCHNEKLEQILKITPYNFSKSDRDTLFLEFNNIEYMKINRYHLNSLHIVLRDKNKNKIIFDHCTFQIKLHFKTNGL